MNRGGSGTAAATQSSAMAGAVNYAAWVLATFRPYLGRAVVEIGVGHGQYRQRLAGLERYAGVDLDPEAVTRAAAADPGGRYLAGDVADPGLVGRLAGGGWDTVLCVNVLEHVERDRQALANLLGVVEPGGHVLLFVPALPALYNDLDRLAGHRRRYTRRALRELVAGLPGEVVRLRYFNGVGGVGWWLNRFRRCTSLEEGAVKGQVALFDRYGVPLARLLDPLTRGFFGQSLVCVIRRRPAPGGGAGAGPPRRIRAGRPALIPGRGSAHLPGEATLQVAGRGLSLLPGNGVQGQHPWDFNPLTWRAAFIRARWPFFGHARAAPGRESWRVAPSQFFFPRVPWGRSGPVPE